MNQAASRGQPQRPQPHGAPARVVVQPFRAADLPALVALWNHTFADRRNFAPVSEETFRRRVLDRPACDPAGLFLAWAVGPDGTARAAGLAHALRPAPQTGVYAKWGGHHFLAVIGVAPEMRRQGIGSRLLQAAENWLYYCPIYAASHIQPCYGTLEQLAPPFFGSTQRLGISATDTGLIRFLARRGYRATDPGDVSMTATLGARPVPPAPDLAALGLAVVTLDPAHPFTGTEPPGRAEYTLRGDNGGAPFAALVLVDGEGCLRGHLSWYPMTRPGWAALAGFWVAPELRGRGLGRYLLDRALADMVQAPPPRGGYTHVEVHTHLTHHAAAAALYGRRGFAVEAAWVNLVKT